jgi:hypothetical protein
MGGMGGDPNPPMTPCEQACTAAGMVCSDLSSCEADICFGTGTVPDCDDEFDTYLVCVGMAPASAFTCIDDKPLVDFQATCSTEFGVWESCLVM